MTKRFVFEEIEFCARCDQTMMGSKQALISISYDSDDDEFDSLKPYNLKKKKRKLNRLNFNFTS